MCLFFEKKKSFSSNLGDQNLVNKFNKQEIIRAGENAVTAEKQRATNMKNVSKN